MVRARGTSQVCSCDREHYEEEKAGGSCNQSGPMVDKWFIDDGQFFLKPAAVDRTLRLLDKHLKNAGASRGTRSEGIKVKSTARLLCPPGREAEHDGMGYRICDGFLPSLALHRVLPRLAGSSL